MHITSLLNCMANNIIFNKDIFNIDFMIKNSFENITYVI